MYVQIDDFLINILQKITSIRGWGKHTLNTLGLMSATCCICNKGYSNEKGFGDHFMSRHSEITHKQIQALPVELQK